MIPTQGFPEFSLFKKSVSNIGTAVMCWGLGSASLTGSSSIACRKPLRLPSLDTFQVTQVAVSVEKFIVLTANNELLEFSLFEEQEPRRIFLVDSSAKGKPITKKITKIACGSGSDMFFALTSTNELFSWGTNEQLLGRHVTPACPAHEPHQIKVDFRVADVCVGSTHVLILSTDYNVYSWGLGRSGRLGQGTSEEDEQLPAMIPGLRSYRVTMIAAGWGHSAALTSDGRVFMWGKNNNGQLGLGEDSGNVDVPRVVRELTSVRLTSVACGAFHTAFLTELGQVYIAGEHPDGKCSSPQLLPLDLWCIDVVCGTFHTVAVCQKGHQKSFYVWGKNSSGEFGLGEEKNTPPQPCVMTFASDWVVLSLKFGMNCGFAVVLKPEEAAEHSTEIEKLLVSSTQPITRTTLSRRRQIASPSAFSNRSLTDEVGTNGSQVWVWGAGVPQYLSHLSNHVTDVFPNAYDSPKAIDYFAEKKVVSIVASQSGCVCLAHDGSVHSVLFESPDAAKLTPETSVIHWKTKTFARQHVKQVACNDSVCFAVTDGGVIFSWIWGEGGAMDLLGREPSGQDRLFPQPISWVTGAVSVTCSNHHVLVLREDMQVMSWGTNNHGQLGHGDTESRKRPLKIRTLQPYRITEVVAGSNHSIALSLDGKAFTWGLGDEGQLGTGGLEDSLVPIRLSDSSVFVSCAAGARYSAFLTNRGAVLVTGVTLGSVQTTVPVQIKLPFWCVSVWGNSETSNCLVVCENPDGTGQQHSAYGWTVHTDTNLGFADSAVSTSPQMVRCLENRQLVGVTFGAADLALVVVVAHP